MLTRKGPATSCSVEGPSRTTNPGAGPGRPLVLRGPEDLLPPPVEGASASAPSPAPEQPHSVVCGLYLCTASGPPD